MSTEKEKVNTPEEVLSQKGKRTKKEKKKKTVKQEIMSWILTLLAAIAIALPIRALVFEPIRVDGESMCNTLTDGSVLLVTKPAYLLGNIDRGDIIICRYPNRNKSLDVNLGGSFELSFTTHTMFVKRLIALPGDKVEIRAGVVYVNDEMVDESGIDKKSVSHENYGPVILGPDSYFVMGDNRANSNDSRRVGSITRDMIVGHARMVLWPLSQFARVPK